ncbi:MAG: DUF3147 family protein [Hyphomicrobiaceae bacterium]
MIESIIKVGITSILVVAIAEISKRSSLFGALIASLPLTSILAMIWLYFDTGDSEKIATLSSGIFWLVLPSLILFIVLPILLRAGVAFAPSLAIAAGLTAIGYVAMVYLLKKFGISL